MLKRGVFTWSRKTISRSRLHGVSINIQDYRWHSSRAMVVDGSNFRITSHLATSSSPGAIEVIVDRKQRGKAVIEAIDSGITDSAHVFEPPVGSIARPWCDTMKIPRLISAFRPEIPPAARFGTGLELNYELTVDAQGNVTS